jgi:hypothetical protein
MGFFVYMSVLLVLKKSRFQLTMSHIETLTDYVVVL